MTLVLEKEDLNFKIFKEFKKNSDYLSGQYLVDKFNISCQDLLQSIKKLESFGYKIEVNSNRSYRLRNSPDKFYPWEIKYNLGTNLVGRAIYFKEVLGSTQDFIRNLGQNGACGGTVVLAQEQKKGKGRRGRSWFSPEEGIYLSCLFRPKLLLAGNIAQVALIMSLACIQAVKKETGISLSVKWPNDIYLEGKKIGGILCELEAEADKVNFFTVGIGINVNTRVLPPEATSLFLSTKRYFSKILLIKEILRQIEKNYLEMEKGNIKELLSSWEKHCFLWGRRLRVEVLDKIIEGEAVGIDEMGCLLLRNDIGFVDKVSSADAIKLT